MTRRPDFRPIRVSENRPGLVWPCAVDPTGAWGPTRAQARSRRWRRTSSGYYLPAGLDPELEVEQRIASAAWIALGVGVVTGWAALRWRGAQYLDDPDVDLAVPRTSFRDQAGVAFTAERVRDEEAEVIDGLAVTTPVVSAAFAARHAADLPAAVATIDRAAAADLVSLDELRDYARHRLAGAVGVVQLRDAIELAVENSWSPTETEMRLLWRSIGLVDPRCATRRSSMLTVDTSARLTFSIPSAASSGSTTARPTSTAIGATGTSGVKRSSGAPAWSTSR